MNDLVVPSADTSLVELTAEVVAAYVVNNSVRPIDLPALIGSVHDTLSGLGQEPAAEVGPMKPLVPIRMTVTDDHIISLEDGRAYKTLKRHLQKFGLTPAGYRAKWSLPADYPMVAPAYGQRRSEIARNIGLGNKRRKAGGSP